MSQCLTCHFYDRRNARTEARGLQWGLCRHNPPQLHPINAKTHAIEGVWPTVRDDDWCGQWRAATRPDATTPARVTGTTPQGPRAPGDVPTQPGVPSAPRTLLHGGASAIAAGYKPTPGKPKPPA